MPWAEAVRQSASCTTGLGVNTTDFPTAFRTALLADPTHATVWPVVRRLWAEAWAWQDALDQQVLDERARARQDVAPVDAWTGAPHPTAARAAGEPTLWVTSPDEPTTAGILLVMAQAPLYVRDRLIRGLTRPALSSAEPHRTDVAPAPSDSRCTGPSHTDPSHTDPSHTDPSRTGPRDAGPRRGGMA